MESIVNRSKASQNKEELLQLLTQVATIEPKVVLEIGAWKGWLLETFNEAFNPIYLLGIEIDSKNIDLDVEKTLSIMTADSHHRNTVKKVKSYFDNKPIDFLFIDADHTYEAVKTDFDMYSPLVRKGGYIGFHDIALVGDKWEGLVEVSRFWNDIKRKYTYYEYFGKNGTGTGLIQI